MYARKRGIWTELALDVIIMNAKEAMVSFLITKNVGKIQKFSRQITQHKLCFIPPPTSPKNINWSTFI